MFQDAFATRTRDEWALVFEGSDACVTRVLSPEEVQASAMEWLFNVKCC